LGVALAESAFAGGLGMKVDLTSIPVDNILIALFSESASRLVVTVHPDKAAAFEKVMAGSAVTALGEVVADTTFTVTGHNGVSFSAPLAELKQAWQGPLRW